MHKTTTSSHVFAVIANFKKLENSQNTRAFIQVKSV